MKKIDSEILKSIRFGLLFRKLAINDNDLNKFNEIEKEIYLNKNKIKIEDVDNSLIVSEIKEIFSKENSSQLLWLYRCISDKEGGLLYRFSPYLKDISKITRGGLNIYKRAGWDIHVLYTYQLICDNFKNNKPTEVEGAIDDFSIFQNTVNSLDNECLFILRISAFMHDIGVVDGVADHEINGVKWVEKRFNEFNFSNEDLSNLGVKLSINEIYSIIKFIVGNHQIINQIGAELGDIYVRDKIKEGQNSLSGYGLKFFNTNIAKIMYLISTADLMAVNDILLTSEKMNETKDAIAFFESVINNKPFERDYTKYGIQRFKALLNDSIKEAFNEEIFKDTISSLGYDFNQIAKFIYEIPRMSYAMTFVKPQKEYSIGLKMFCLIYEKIRRDNINVKNISLKFDPDINYDELGSYLSNNSIDKTLEEEKIELIYNKEQSYMSIKYKN